MPIPAPAWSYPTKDELADYLESYAARFELPVRTGVSVDGLQGRRSLRRLCGRARFEAENVIVATGAHRIPTAPAFAPELDPRIGQLHSSEYLNPSQLQEGGVLVVGAGNSGAEIAAELSRTHRCLLAGPKVDEIPCDTAPCRLVSAFGLPVLRASRGEGRHAGRPEAGPEAARQG